MSYQVKLTVEDRLMFWRSKGFAPKTILDIGAHVGEWSLGARLIWPEAKIWMVEANEDARQNLEKLKHLGGYEISLLGKEEKPSVDYFNCLGEFNTGNSVYKEKTSFFENCEVRKLSMTTLDKLVEKLLVSKFDLVKIDTQGSELDIIIGGIETVNKAEAILLETQTLEYNLGAPMAKEVISKMSNLGFEILDILDIHYLPTGELFQLDILFARNDSALFKTGELYTA